MNIFERDTEFVELDNRRHRTHNRCSAESLYKKFQVELPEELVKGQTVLDLGSCLGAAGHWALGLGAQHYTGVEIQDYYVNTSNTLLSKHWVTDQFCIVQQDIETFLDQAIAANQRYDYVVAAGITYGFMDVISLLKKIAAVSSNYIVVDTRDVGSNKNNNGVILLKPTIMIRGKDSETKELYQGIGSLLNLKAIDIVLSTCSFARTGPVLLPEKLSQDTDVYRDTVKFASGETKPLRYIARYQRHSTAAKTITDIILGDDDSAVVPFN